MPKDGIHFPIAKSGVEGDGHAASEGRIGLGITGQAEVMMERFEDRPAIGDAGSFAGVEKLFETAPSG